MMPQKHKICLKNGQKFSKKGKKTKKMLKNAIIIKIRDLYIKHILKYFLKQLPY